MAESDGKVTVQMLKNICVKMQHPALDFTVIQPGIVLGGISTAKNTDLLTTLGVTHVINAAYDKTGKGNFIYVDINEPYYDKRGFKCEYLGIRAMDTVRFKIDKYFDQAIEFMEDALSKKGVVYIHCYMGISRSAVIVIAYLIAKQNMSVVEAFKYVRSKREIFPNDGFLQQLIDYEERIKATRTNPEINTTS